MLHVFHLILAAADEAADSPLKPYMFLWLGVIISLSYFLLLKTRRRVRRSQQFSHLDAKERIAQFRKTDTNHLQVQIEELMAELADLSREINGQIDTRLAKLNALLDEADRTIARFEQTMGHPEGSASSPGTKNESLGRNETSPVHNQQQNRKNLTAADHVLRTQKAPDAQTQAILDMAHQGKTAVSIAQKLGRPVGEIELILALNKK